MQLVLDLFGLIPGAGEPVDALNATISLARGERVGAALSAASMLPVGGDLAAKSVKWGRLAAKWGGKLQDAGTLARTAGRVADAARQVDGFVPYDDVVANAKRLRAPRGAGTRQLRLPQTNPRLAGTNTLGETLPNGEVYLRPGLTRAQQATTLRHESVHAYLSVADDAPFAAFRQNVGVGAYNRSSFFQATEEILAQSYATGSIRQGIRHAFNGEYRLLSGRVVTPLNYAVEVGVGATGLGALGYGAYQVGTWLWGDE